jgi:hypothetical protein
VYNPYNNKEKRHKDKAGEEADYHFACPLFVFKKPRVRGERRQARSTCERTRTPLQEGSTSIIRENPGKV